MSRLSILLAELLIFLAVLGLRIYLHKRKMKKIICIEMKSENNK